MNYLNIFEQSQIDKLKAQLEKKEQSIQTLQKIIESQKEQINQYQHEKQQLIKNIQQQVQQKFQDDLHFENMIRKLKQDLQKKSIEFEQMTMRVNENDPSFLQIKLKNEAAEPYRIEILQKEQQNEELKRHTVQLKNQLQLQIERNKAIEIANKMNQHNQNMNQIQEWINYSQNKQRSLFNQMKKINNKQKNF